MTFVFPLLLGGLALAGIPVVLHLIVRQQPRRLPFPALRFLMQKQRTNTRKLRLRHFLLLALRMLLIVALCVGLARPRLFYQGMNLSSERPVAAVLVFDTSASMDYRSGDVSRLDEAKKRGLELIDKLPAGCRFLVVDSAEVLHRSAAEPWLRSADAARQRITALKIRPANVAVTRALEPTLKRLDELARNAEDPDGRRLLRLLCVFTDRTRACWDVAQEPPLQEAVEQIPPLYEGVVQARGRLSALEDLVRVVRERLPSSTADYRDGSLLEALAALREEARGLTPEASFSEALVSAVRQVRRLGRDLYEQTRATGPNDTASDYREQLRSALAQVLQDLAGTHALLVDVGVEQPVDLALLQLDMPRDARGPRQVFAEGEKISVQAAVQATGKDLSNRLALHVAGKKLTQPVELKAGMKTLLPPFEIDTATMPLGPHQAEARFEGATDALPINNQAFLTFAIRPKQRLLVLADDPLRAEQFVRGLKVLPDEYSVELHSSGEKLPALGGFQAIYLVGVADPSASLWQALDAFVRQGGGLGVFPAGDDLKPEAYNQAAAQAVLPGTIKDKVTAKEPGVPWNWDAGRAAFQQPFLQKFKDWIGDAKTDFVVYPRGAVAYWAVAPASDGSVVVSYRDDKNRPAVLARSLGRGSVLMFTTTMDQREPAWNNYVASVTAFYVAVLSESAHVLSGEPETRTLNFTLGRDAALVALPAGTNLPRYSLVGPELLENVNPGATGSVAFKDLAAPGNYLLEGRTAGGERQVLGGFSMNLPPEESDLSRVPEVEIERVLGPGSVVALDRHVELPQALAWTEPFDLFPALMVLLLVAFALENLLANRFYRQPPAEAGV